MINGGFDEIEPSVFKHLESGEIFTSVADAYIYLEVIQEMEEDSESTD